MPGWLTILSAVANVVLAAVAVAALWATIWLIRENKAQFLQHQQQLQDALGASQRPCLIPFGELELEDGISGRYFDFDHLDPGQPVRIRNSGSGIAFNVRGVLMQPRPHVEAALAQAPRARSMVLDAPIPPGATAGGDEKGVASMAGPSVFGWDTHVGEDARDTLAAPENALVRLTLTYTDVFGHVHASQFDYVEHRSTEAHWVFVGSGRRFRPTPRRWRASTTVSVPASD